MCVGVWVSNAATEKYKHCNHSYIRMNNNIHYIFICYVCVIHTMCCLWIISNRIIIYFNLNVFFWVLFYLLHAQYFYMLHSPHILTASLPAWPHTFLSVLDSWSSSFLSILSVYLYLSAQKHTSIFLAFPDYVPARRLYKLWHNREINFLAFVWCISPAVLQNHPFRL